MIIEPNDIIYYGFMYRLLVIEVNVDTFWVYSFDRGTYHCLSTCLLKYFNKFD